MATAERRSGKPAANLSDPQYYISRELSWIEFNRRVLHEALDERTPLLEALKFLAIFSNNLDEYFMVRVAALKQRIEAQVTRRSPDGRSPQAHLDDVSAALRPIVEQQHQIFSTDLRQQMADQGIWLLTYDEMTAAQQTYCRNYFEEQIFPVLTPLAVDPGHPFPYISNLSLNLAVVVQDPHTQQPHFARVKVPRVLPRFISLTETQGEVPDSQTYRWLGVPLEQVIAANLSALFPGMVVQGHYCFRITRDADLAVEEDEADDLMLAIEQELRKRRVGGSAVRMEIQRATPGPVRAMLIEELGLAETDVYDIDGLLGLGDLMTFMALPLPDLKAPRWSAAVPPALKRLSPPGVEDDDTTLETAEDLFSLLRQQEQLLHHPYHSFSATVQRFITQAAHDPQVLAIKMTLYRTSGDSPIVSSLISAAENGKQVTVLVEIKARFDEENNINWARKLEQSGVHVVYGLVGLKTHCKVTLVVRREGQHIRRYYHIGTGNYNPKTARVYTDLGLLSARDDVGADISDLFNYLTGYSRQQVYRQLLVAPLTLRQRLVSLIEHEIACQKKGKGGRIIIKLNSLVDPDLIALLYRASQAGVSIDLIVRGICCLRPGVPGVSDKIRVISIVGQFLEHSRVVYFQQGGEEVVLLGSADWMPRNLNRRVEVMVPVIDPALQAELKAMLNLCLEDNRQAWDLATDGSYRQRRPEEGEEICSVQEQLMASAGKLLAG
ncbi:polyphosphate kinase 1 [Phormidium tenue]|uniref:Polyphosphate kinase n=1 Tax=Phormidium tenue NIES-30 TaxID=549789 RepID=A0A1U7J2W3_9CYAN|nr:polyphosphate kinase 1 [Phormidium tenue]MBD2231867.1 polyphosphate kinase 1 [Phormidium tenue FACHB-1052]OKH46424.1 RNA degradosome polyphosphate kinase [Phormidium tenue NIES-30]